jgi:hypothetical protein
VVLAGVSASPAESTHYSSLTSPPTHTHTHSLSPLINYASEASHVLLARCGLHLETQVAERARGGSVCWWHMGGGGVTVCACTKGKGKGRKCNHLIDGEQVGCRRCLSDTTESVRDGGALRESGDSVRACVIR